MKILSFPAMSLLTQGRQITFCFLCCALPLISTAAESEKTHSPEELTATHQFLASEKERLESLRTAEKERLESLQAAEEAKRTEQKQIANYQRHQKKIQSITLWTIQEIQGVVNQDSLLGYKLGLVLLHEMKQKIQGFLANPNRQADDLTHIQSDLQKTIKEERKIFKDIFPQEIVTQPTAHFQPPVSISTKQEQFREEYAAQFGVSVDPLIERQLIRFFFDGYPYGTKHGCGLESYMGCGFCCCVPGCKLGGAYGRVQPNASARLRLEARCSVLGPQRNDNCCGDLCACPSLSAGIYYGKRPMTVDSFTSLSNSYAYFLHSLHGVWDSIGFGLCVCANGGMSEESCGCSLPLCAIKEGPDLDEFLTELGLIPKG